MMSKITDLAFLSPADQQVYYEALVVVRDALASCFPSHTMAPCHLLDEKSMDDIFPPEIWEVWLGESKERIVCDIRAFVEAEIEKPEVRRYFGDWLDNLDSETRKYLLDWWVYKVRAFIYGEKLDSRGIKGPREEGFGEVASQSADIVGYLTFNNKTMREEKEKADSEKKCKGVFVAMGCYVNGNVYLCPSRIAAANSSLRTMLVDLITCVWLHEEMHALLRSSGIERQAEEHIVQTMTAATLSSLQARSALACQIKLAKKQPDAYALFCRRTNIFIIDPTKKSKKIPVRLGHAVQEKDSTHPQGIGKMEPENAVEVPISKEALAGLAIDKKIEDFRRRYGDNEMSEEEIAHRLGIYEEYARLELESRRFRLN